jgi:hypothetical protein
MKDESFDIFYHHVKEDIFNAMIIILKKKNYTKVRDNFARFQLNFYH